MPPVRELRVPQFIHLYNGAHTPSLNSSELAEYLNGKLPRVDVDLRGEFLRHWLGDADRQKISVLAAQLARIKVRQPDKQEQNPNPIFGEVEFEARFLATDRKKPTGILYDGFCLTGIYAELIPPDEAELDHCHIALTDQLFGTWDEADRRYHARAAVFGYPSIISTTGLVEAPAKSREFYLRRQIGEDELALKQEFAGRFIDHEDPRMTEVIKGYLLQALFYHAAGDPFCPDENCRLFNAHWQEQLIRAQLGDGAELCSRHGAMLEAMC